MYSELFFGIILCLARKPASVMFDEVSDSVEMRKQAMAGSILYCNSKSHH